MLGEEIMVGGFGEGAKAEIKAAYTADGRVTYEFKSRDEVNTFIAETAKAAARWSAAQAIGGPILAGPINSALEYFTGSTTRRARSPTMSSSGRRSRGTSPPVSGSRARAPWTSPRLWGSRSSRVLTGPRSPARPPRTQGGATITAQQFEGTSASLDASAFAGDILALARRCPAGLRTLAFAPRCRVCQATVTRPIRLAYSDPESECRP